MGFLNLEYNLENVGTIDKAKVTIKPLTIIAGENSTGKTFITKSLYTILNSIYKNHHSEQLVKKYESLDNHYRYLINSMNTLATIDKEFDKKFVKFSEKIRLWIAHLADCNFDVQESLDNDVKKTFAEYNKIILEHFEQRAKLKKFKKYKDKIDDIIMASENLLWVAEHRRDVIVEEINSHLETGLKKNYQITNLQSIVRRNQKKDLKLEIDGIGNVTIDQKSDIKFTFNTKGIQEVQNVKNIVFFDSPVYIKIRKALERSKERSSIRGWLQSVKDDKYLKGYPEYLEELYSYMDREYIDTADFESISQEIQLIISGKLDMTKSGDINYTDNNGNTIPLSLTAMGISNIGLIDLLLRNNVINKGSFLIMDEPEVHLHPEWQVILANMLYKIAKNGANIIIATHSLDMLKAFQVLLKDKNENAEEVIAINKVPYQKEFASKSELEKVTGVLDDLSKPFYNLYMQDL